MAIICPVYKKGDKLNCSNYRGISLLSVVYKIFINTLARYLEAYTEEILEEYQCEFRKGRSTTDQIFMLRQIIEKTYEFNVDIHLLFIDYKQAYDSINRQQMCKIMKEFGIPEKLINLVKMTLRRTLNKVKSVVNYLTVLKQHAASDKGMHFLPCCLTSCWKR
jgi:sorting nexin-29